MCRFTVGALLVRLERENAGGVPLADRVLCEALGAVTIPDTVADGHKRAPLSPMSQVLFRAGTDQARFHLKNQTLGCVDDP